MFTYLNVTIIVLTRLNNKTNTKNITGSPESRKEGRKEGRKGGRKEGRKEEGRKEGRCVLNFLNEDLFEKITIYYGKKIVLILFLI
jgi:hypothetical protein